MQYGPGHPDQAALAKLGELKTRDKCEKAYLDFVRDWQVYGSTFWHVQPQGTMEFPSHVILAIHPKGVLIINPDTFEILKSYKYNEIPQWGSSKSSFVLYVGNLIKQTKTFFSTPTETQGDEMNVSGGLAWCAFLGVFLCGLVPSLLPSPLF